MTRTLSVVNRAWIVPLSCLLMTACGLAEARAQTAGRAAPAAPRAAVSGTLVAVMDLPRVFDQHPGFKSSQAILERDAAAIEADLNARNQALGAKSKQLKELRVDTPDYRRMEAELARQAADLQVLARQKQNELRTREAKLYYQTYMEIQSTVARVAERHQINLVLRFDSRPIDPDDIQSVARGMGQAVVMQQNLDITQLVVDELPKFVAANQPGGLPRR